MLKRFMALLICIINHIMNNVLKFTLKKQNERPARKMYNIFTTTFYFMVHTLYYVDKAVTNKKTLSTTY